MISGALRILGFFIFGVLILAIANPATSENIDRDRAMMMMIIALILIMIGYLGDIARAIKANTAVKKVDVSKP